MDNVAPSAPTPVSSVGPTTTFANTTPEYTPSVSYDESGVIVSLDTLLENKKGYVKPKSIAGSRTSISYEQFCAQLSFEYLDSLLKSPNLLDVKSNVIKIKKHLVFALTNTKDLPDELRIILFDATMRFVDFLKAAVYYPDKDKLNDEIIAYLPILKDTAFAFRSFLLKNR